MDDDTDIAVLARDIRVIAETIKTHGGNPCPFSDDEIERIKRGAQIVEWFDTLGWLGKRVLALTRSRFCGG